MSKIAGVLKDFYAAHQQKVFQASAPGRLDVMGGIADYAGSLLLQRPLSQETTAYMAFREDRYITIRLFFKGEERSFVTNYDDIVGNFKTINYDYCRKELLSREGGEWAVYIVGCLLVLYNEMKIKPEGVNMVITSGVPFGKELASTAAVDAATVEAATVEAAALEVAVLKVMKAGLNLDMNEYEIPALAQKAENLVAGKPCGIAGQLTAFAGKQNKLTPMICQPHEAFHPIDIPDAIQFAGIDTGIRHEEVWDHYIAARTASYMGYSIIALAAGASIRDLEWAKELSDWSKLPYGGYLANINPSEFEDKHIPLLPEKISGEAFIDKYRTVIDPFSFIDRDKEYRLLSCTRHPVYENFRVKLFSQIIKNYTTEFQNYSDRLSLMGELMYQSHQSYTDCGLGHERADEIIQMVKNAGQKKGLYGARVTGIGGGGTVCILCGGLSGTDNASKIHQQYTEKYGLETMFVE